MERVELEAWVTGESKAEVMPTRAFRGRTCSDSNTSPPLELVTSQLPICVPGLPSMSTSIARLERS